MGEIKGGKEKRTGRRGSESWSNKKKIKKLRIWFI
jgi:hypothetical protein